MRSNIIRNYYVIIQRVVFYAWLFSFLVLLLLLWLQPGLFSRDFITGVLGHFELRLLLFIYFLVCVVRGMFLLPSTPFILAGMVLFGHHEALVFFLSIISILISAALIYHFSEYLGLDTYFLRRYPRKVARFKRYIHTKHGFWFLVFWSFFPAVPTDLMCYVAGTVRMHFGRFMLAVFLGEVPLVLISVYGFEYVLRLCS